MKKDTFALHTSYRNAFISRIMLAIFGDGTWIVYAALFYTSKDGVVLLYFLLSFSIFFIIWTAAIFLSFFFQEPYELKVRMHSLDVLSKKGKLIRSFYLCTLVFPVINLKYIWRDEFLRKNRKVHLSIRNEENTNVLVIGKGFMRYGTIPMREAVEIENWIKEWKERLCGMRDVSEFKKP